MNTPKRETEIDMNNLLNTPPYHLRRIRGWTYVYQGEQRVTPKGSDWHTAEQLCNKLNDERAGGLAATETLKARS
jgi:hypothetical protein